MNLYFTLPWSWNVMNNDSNKMGSLTANNNENIASHELVKILYYQPINKILAGHAVAVIMTVIFMWDIVSHQWLLVWSSILFGQTMIWLAVVASFRRIKPTIGKSKHWLTIFPLAGALTGLSWGMTSLWPSVLLNPSSMVFLAIMVLGVTAAGLAVFAPYLRSFTAFASCTLLPFVIHFYFDDSKLHLTLGIMFLLYLSVILLNGYNMKQAVRKSIELRLENLGLVDDLLIKKTQAESARDDAEQAYISKSKFLAAASHDLRQPLHALGLFVDALESRIHYPEVRSIVDNIRISTDALGDLLNALLDISRLDAGVLEPNVTEFQLQHLLKRIYTDFNELASSKSLCLKIVDCGFTIRTDPSMLERILRNLVSNAIRYTQQGEVKLNCCRHDGRVAIEIHDTGIGVAPDKIDNIFEEFYQIANTERDRRKGLGLGLAIVKRLALLLDCPITVSSIPDKGSVFRITAPYVASYMPEIDIEQNYVKDVQGTRVMVIDDEAIVRLGMRQNLEEWGCIIKEAESIEHALAVLGNDCAIDIIITDYRLRENKNGIEAIHAIYAACGKEIPAIILTGDTDPKHLCEEAKGFSVLYKPVSSAKLRSLMSYLLDQN